MRPVRGDGSVIYKNGDHTRTRALKSRCPFGFKHFWDGQEYDNLPQMVTVTLMDGNGPIFEQVPWFQNESDPSMNSNAYNVASKVVQKYFPGKCLLSCGSSYLSILH